MTAGGRARGDLGLEPEEDVVARPLAGPDVEPEVVVEAQLVDRAAAQELDRLLWRPDVDPPLGRRPLVV